MEWNKYFRYDEDGSLIWLPRSDSEFAKHGSCEYWNRKNAGHIAGTRRFNRGRPAMICIQVNGNKYLAHRIIWEMHHGPIPDGMKVDHRDMDPWNNRLVNLRLATNSQNMCNRPKQANNTSGYKGVCWDAVNEKWMAQIRAGGVSRILGRFHTAEEAYEAYCDAAKAAHGEFVRL